MREWLAEAACRLRRDSWANRLPVQSGMRNTEKEEVSGTARNTLILEFKASTSCLEQDNPIMPQVTAVHTEREAQLTSE